MDCDALKVTERNKKRKIIAPLIILKKKEERNKIEKEKKTNSNIHNASTALRTFNLNAVVNDIVKMKLNKKI